MQEREAVLQSQISNSPIIEAFSALLLSCTSLLHLSEHISHSSRDCEAANDSLQPSHPFECCFNRRRRNRHPTRSNWRSKFNIKMVLLRQLYPSSEDEASPPTQVDIVAVHGLNPFNKDPAKHAWDTWRKPAGKKGHLWLRDDLPKELPEARIFLCQYDSSVAYGKDRSSFIDKANALLEVLTMHRRKDNQRPLLFLGHSLGGLLIKQALINAHNNQRYTPIKNATCGLAFFATPHSGGGVTPVKWGNAVAEVAIALGFKAGHNILETLKSGSIFTDIMTEHWRHQLMSYDIRSFWGTSDTVIPKESARFGMAGTHENIVPLDRDHSTICKFDDSEDDHSDFMIVKGNLWELYDLALGRVVPPKPTRLTPEQAHLCHRLFTTDQEEYMNDLKRKKGIRARGTCEWIMQTDELQKWLGIKPSPSAEHASSILWLYGNPGTGKSTMAITMVEELPKQPYFIYGIKSLAYFFCDSSSEDQRTATSILRTLIYQFVTQYPTLSRFLPEEQANLQSFVTLWSLLMNIGDDTATGQKYCIIDALDECDDVSKKELLDQIKRQFTSHTPRDSQPKIKILIISRGYPEIKKRLQIFDSKDLASYPNTVDDLTTFIKEKVDELATDEEYPQQTIDEVIQILHDKAEKSFLWIGIVCHNLIDVPSKDVVKRLTILHPGLEKLYEKLLNEALEYAQQEDNYETIRQIINFVVVSRRPLTVSELAEACQLYPGDDSRRGFFTQENIQTWRLMVVIRNDTVQLLHNSVRDFLLDPSNTLSISESEAHVSMANRCINVLQRTLRQGRRTESRSETDGFLKYALLHWPQHASSAQNDFSVVGEIESFFRIESEERENWLIEYRKKRRFERIPEMFSVFHVAARWEIPSLVPFALSEISGSDEKQSTQDNDQDIGTYGGSILAMFSGFQVAVRWVFDSLALFTSSEISGSDEKEITQNINQAIRVYDDSKFVAKNGVTPLEEAARRGHTGIVDILLKEAPITMSVSEAVVVAAAANRRNGKELMAVLLNERGDQIRVTEAVVKAAAGNRGKGEEVMTLLLEQRGQQIQITERVVEAAAGNQTKGKEVMTLLLDQRGHQIEISENVVRAAAWNRGGKGVMELLLDRRGHQIQITKDVIKTAADNRGGKAVLELLLDRQGYQMEISEGVLKAAAGNCMKGREMMELLLDQRGHQNSRTTLANAKTPPSLVF